MRFSSLRFLPCLFRKTRPVQLTVFLTRKCNARCSFCFYLSRTSPSEEDAPELTLDELSEVSRHTGRLLWLALSGGEFFLRPDLVEVVEAFYRNSSPSIILLPTNGIATDLIVDKVSQIVRRSPRSTVVVKVSVDGQEETHDRLRGVSGARRKAMETCRELGRMARCFKNLEVGVNSVFCRANEAEMEALVREIRALGEVTTHTVSMVRDKVGDPSLPEVDWARYEQVADRLAGDLMESRGRRYRFSGARLKAAQDVLQRRTIRETARVRRSQGPCYAGKLTLVLTETGDVFPCESFTRKLGNVRSDGYDLQALVKQKRSLRIIDGINREGCWCTHECYHMMNILFNPRRVPELAREFLRLPGGPPLFAPRSSFPSPRHRRLVNAAACPPESRQ